MSKFILKDDFLELFPDVEIGVVTAKNITNDPAELGNKNDEIYALLQQSFEEAGSFMQNEVFIENLSNKIKLSEFEDYLKTI